MPDLIIDGRPVSVPEGTMVIDAAERLGIMIPRFCYHKALRPAEACRMCAVMFVEGPVKGLKMSCATKAVEGMVVETGHPEAVAFRRQVIEWLMRNHPHDCPVCDEGGQCLLQDETISGNHCLRDAPSPKRTYRDQYIGPFVQHEMNRCIHCYRCSRFYQEYAGGRDFGPMQNANRVYFGRFADGPLESAFSGNLADICPTGVFTDKSARFKARRWDLERAPSVCPHCSLGCNTVVDARYREVVRVEARLNEAVNGYFLCDRGRFSHGFAHLEGRPRHARLNGRAMAEGVDDPTFGAIAGTGTGGAPGGLEVGVAEGVARAAGLLRDVAARHGSEAVACIGSARCCLETLGELARVAKAAGYLLPAHFACGATRRAVHGAVNAMTAENVRSRAALERADAILCLGTDPLAEAPMLALALRQATERKGLVIVADARPVTLPLPFVHLPVAATDLPACLDLLATLAGGDLGAASAGDVAVANAAGGDAGTSAPAVGASASQPGGLAGQSVPSGGVAALCRAALPGYPQLWPRLEAAAKTLAACKVPVIACGTGLVPPHLPALAGAAAARIGAAKDGCGLFFTLPGANAFGAALLETEDVLSVEDVISGIEAGRIKALLAVESDPFAMGLGDARLRAALNRLEALVVLDHLPTALAAAADVFLPATALFESGGTLVNNEGRLQLAAPAYAPGLPVRQDGHGGHPPREFDRGGLGRPGADPQPSWQLLAEILAASGGAHPPADLWTAIAQNAPALAHLPSAAYPFDGLRVSARPVAQTPSQSGDCVVVPSGGNGQPATQASPEGGDHGVSASGQPLASGDVSAAMPAEAALRTEQGLTTFGADPAAESDASAVKMGTGALNAAPGTLAVLFAERFLGTEEQGRYSAFLCRVTPYHYACLHARDGLSLGLVDGGRAFVELGGRSFEIGLRLREDMSPGVLILPRHPDFMPDWPEGAGCTATLVRPAEPSGAAASSASPGTAGTAGAGGQASQAGHAKASESGGPNAITGGDPS